MILLYFTCKDKAPVLTDDSREALKQLWKDFAECGRHPVEMDINIADLDDTAVQLIREDVIKICGYEAAKKSLLKEFQSYRKSLAYAAEHLVQDEVLDACTGELEQRYIDRYGIENCSYENRAGKMCFYWTAFLWIDIIEEMLKEFTLELGRSDYYGHLADKYRKVELFVNAANGKTIWSFMSYIEINPDDEKYRKLADMFKTYMWGDFLDIPKKDLALRIYPDLFYCIGLLKAMDQARYEKLCEYKGVFDLMHYNIGLA